MPVTPPDERLGAMRAMFFGVASGCAAFVVTCCPPTLRRWLGHGLDVVAIWAGIPVAQTVGPQTTASGHLACIGQPLRQDGRR
jgi:hypothetical protein